MSADHVPPKCLFAPVSRVNLITVPACRTCNSSYKLDDEYFRLVLSIRADLPKSRAAQYIRDSTLRSLRKPEAQKLRRSIVSSTRQFALRDAYGFQFGQVGRLRVNYSRLKNTAERIVKGFYYHFYSSPLPKAYEVDIVLIDLLDHTDFLQGPEISQLLSHLAIKGYQLSRGEICSIRACASDDDAYSTFWFVHLFGTFGFFAFTAPKDG